MDTNCIVLSNVMFFSCGHKLYSYLQPALNHSWTSLIQTLFDIFIEKFDIIGVFHIRNPSADFLFIIYI